jgi:tRNA(Arg) A34 adenosine deaminase TadA
MTMSNHDLQHLRKAIRLADQARSNGNAPFGAVLVDADGEILLEAENTRVTDEDCTAHAETNLVRKASRNYSRSRLLGCTLYASAEPCAMCAGAIYWSGIGRVVFALGSRRLYEHRAPDADRLDIPCREVLSRGQRPIDVVGPPPELEEEALRVFS